MLRWKRLTFEFNYLNHHFRYVLNILKKKKRRVISYETGLSYGTLLKLNRDVPLSSHNGLKGIPITILLCRYIRAIQFQSGWQVYLAGGFPFFWRFYLRCIRKKIIIYIFPYYTRPDGNYIFFQVTWNYNEIYSQNYQKLSNLIL